MNTEAQYTTESSSANFSGFSQPDRKAEGVCSKQCREFFSIQISAFKAREKRKKQNAIVVFHLKAKIKFGLFEKWGDTLL